MKIPIELSRKKSAYSVYVYGALDVRLFSNKRLNVDLKNIEIWVSHGLKAEIRCWHSDSIEDFKLIIYKIRVFIKSLYVYLNT